MISIGPWSQSMRVASIVCHSVAISSTVLRLGYRWRMARFWWEDGVAALALACDAVSLTSVVMMAPYPGSGNWTFRTAVSAWLSALSIPPVMWAARVSVLLSVVRVGNPSPTLKKIAVTVGISFIIMFFALEGQRIYVCLSSGCRGFGSTGVSQLVTDVVADFSLVALPIWSLSAAKLSRSRRVLIQSAFTASMIITIITIIHSIILLTQESSGVLLIAHIKAALSLMICNLLVIVTFVYRVCCKGQFDLEQENSGIRMEFTTIEYYPGTMTTEGRCAKSMNARMGPSRRTFVSVAASGNP
ncbi:hypothetical protein EDC04DRAFT_2780235 [Pisolithus marmoratus]|nr:hypothetical protein EDC04DRAFT_2780235 [Pisolithus marmoratus]